MQHDSAASGRGRTTEADNVAPGSGETLEGGARTGRPFHVAHNQTSVAAEFGAMADFLRDLGLDSLASSWDRARANTLAAPGWGSCDAAAGALPRPARPAEHMNAAVRDAAARKARLELRARLTGESK